MSRSIALLLGGWLTGAAALAEPLADPTRPPVLFDRPQQESVAPASGPVLQSVLIAPGRSEAIISGQTVKVGDRIGDARVVRIAEGEVVLRNGAEIQTLKVFPGMEKQPTYRQVSVKPGQRTQEK